MATHPTSNYKPATQDDDGYFRCGECTKVIPHGGLHHCPCGMLFCQKCISAHRAACREDRLAGTCRLCGWKAHRPGILEPCKGCRQEFCAVCTQKHRDQGCVAIMGNGSED